MNFLFLDVGCAAEEDSDEDVHAEVLRGNCVDVAHQYKSQVENSHQDRHHPNNNVKNNRNGDDEEPVIGRNTEVHVFLDLKTLREIFDEEEGHLCQENKVFYEVQFHFLQEYVVLAPVVVADVVDVCYYYHYPLLHFLEDS